MSHSQAKKKGQKAREHRLRCSAEGQGFALMKSKGKVALTFDEGTRALGTSAGPWMTRKEAEAVVRYSDAHSRVLEVSVTLPPPNPQGDDDSACIVCWDETDTALAFVGHAEWAEAGLTRLGVPFDQAVSIVLEACVRLYGTPQGMVPTDAVTLPFQVCMDCAKKVGMRVGQRQSGIPALVQGLTFGAHRCGSFKFKMINPADDETMFLLQVRNAKGREVKELLDQGWMTGSDDLSLKHSRLFVTGNLDLAMALISAAGVTGDEGFNAAELD